MDRRLSQKEARSPPFIASLQSIPRETGIISVERESRCCTRTILKRNGGAEAVIIDDFSHCFREKYISYILSRIRRKFVSFRRFQEYLYLVFFFLLFSNINITCIERKRGERERVSREEKFSMYNSIAIFIVLYRTLSYIVGDCPPTV